jgi:hypothetical protein
MWRWLLLGLLACGDPAVPAQPTHVVEVASFPAASNRDLDLLFQVDDSGSTSHFQQSLMDAFPVLVESLVIDGELANLHIGVTTSDLGTLGSLDPATPGPSVGQVGQGGCAGVGKDGALTTSGAAITGNFLIDESDGAGGRTRNYQGTLAATFRFMLSVGATGCGFEQPLAATRRALTRPQSAGFVRPDASLAIIMIADEDDCSVRDAAGFFSPDETVLGTLQSYRCTHFGLTCYEGLDDVGAKAGCVPREDSQFVEGVEPFVEFFASLKPPEKLVFGGIFGDPAPVNIETRVINGSSQLALAHSCFWNLSTGVANADPAVRMAALVDHFESRGVSTTVCQDDLSSNVRAIGLAIKRSLGVACIDTSKLADASDEPGVQPACEVDLVDINPQLITPIPQCPADGTCYEIRDDALACPETADHARVVITRDQPPPAGQRIDMRCEVP